MELATDVSHAVLIRAPFSLCSRFVPPTRLTFHKHRPCIAAFNYDLLNPLETSHLAATMRISALAPVLLCTAALVLSFLCLFAGSKRGFMNDYSILTLNTSRIGASFLNAAHSSSNPLISFIDNATNSVENAINQDVSSVARTLGIHDFYSMLS